MTDYEKAYRDLRAAVEALATELDHGDDARRAYAGRDLRALLAPAPASETARDDVIRALSKRATDAERDLEAEIERRDEYADLLDQFAASVPGDHGEHSSANDPWANALEALDGLRDRLAARQSDPDATEREALAKAWDEGFDAGERDVFEHERTTFDQPCIANPYRRTVTTGEWTEVGE